MNTAQRYLLKNSYSNAVNYIEQLELDNKITKKDKDVLIQYFSQLYRLARSRANVYNFLNQVDNMFMSSFVNFDNQLEKIFKEYLGESYRE